MKTVIFELATQIFTSRTVSRSEQQQISVLLAQDDLDVQERMLAERLLYGVRRGLLTVVE